MAENLRAVSIGEMVVTNKPDDILVAYGLGSCVAVCLYDPVAKVAGMTHSLLPMSTNGHNGRDSAPAKYVNQGVPELLSSVVSLGAKRHRLRIQICGGAQMLNAPGMNDTMNIGQRNALAAQEALSSIGLRINAQDTGGTAGRTVRLYVANGRVTVKKLGKSEEDLM